MTCFKSFDELAVDTRRKITSFCDYSAKYLSRYDAIVKLIGSVMEEHGVVYSHAIADEWVRNLISLNEYGDSTRWRYSRAINCLSSNWNNEFHAWKIYPAVSRISPADFIFKKEINSFENYLYVEGYAEKTVYTRVFSANQFLSWAENNEISSFDCIDPFIVSKYLASEHFQNRKAGGVSTEIIGLRKFLVYLEDKKILKTNCHSACLSHKNRSKRIVTVYTDEQIKTLLKPLPKPSANLRNRAIFVLGLKCGLRSCDIMNLKFENIDFDNKLLSLIQQKTKVPLTIPFDSEVSNALIDYILKERRAGDLPYVFVTVNGPVRKLTHTTSFKTTLHFKGEEEPENGGLHILRRTYASSLLASDINISAIAAVLGHIGLSSVDRYLSTDEKKMKKCALSIEKFQYTGGLF